MSLRSPCWSSPGSAGSGDRAQRCRCQLQGTAGRYTVYAYDGYRLPNGGLEYRLVLLNRATGEPARDVVPLITARRQGGTSPAQSAHVTVMANVVLYDLPNPYPDDWIVSVACPVRSGDGRATFPMHGQAPYVAPEVHQKGGGGA